MGWIGYDVEASERLMKRLRKLITVPMGVKLPPYFDPVHHTLMGDAIGRCSVDFLNLINSVGNGLVVPNRMQAMGPPGAASPDRTSRGASTCGVRIPPRAMPS